MTMLMNDTRLAQGNGDLWDGLVEYRHCARLTDIRNVCREQVYGRSSRMPCLVYGRCVRYIANLERENVPGDVDNVVSFRASPKFYY